MLSALTSEAGRNSSLLTQVDISNFFAIGMDELRYQAFFLKNDKVEMVDLTKYKSCELHKITRQIEQGRSYTTITEKIQLDFQPYYKGESVLTWELFDAETELNLTDQFELAQKWSKLFSRQMNNNWS